MNLERPYLVIVFGVLLFLGISNLWGHRLQHEFPYSYMASDTFQQQTRAEGIKEAGNYRFEPFYIVKGYQDVVGYYPPVIHHLGIILNFSSGIPLYDTIYFMVFFNAILAAFVMYIIIRSYSKQIAILSLPLSVLVFSSKPYVGFLWGHWASITGQLFLICIFWSLSKIGIEKMEIVLGIFVGALALAHTSELLYGIVFILIYMAYLLVRKQFNLKSFRKLITAGFIAGIVSFYILFIFIKSFAVINPYSFEVSSDWGGTPLLYMADFRLLLIFLAIGAIASLLMLKQFDILIISGFYMLGIGYTNYIGFGIRAFQPRLLWPVYFSFFFGLGIYTILKWIPQNKRGYSILIAGLLSLFILAGFIPSRGIPTYSKVSNPGLMDQWHWQAFQWLSQNTPKDAKLYFFYGDVYDQDAILRNSKRVHVQVIPEDYIESLKNRTIRRDYKFEAPADHGAGMPYFKSFLNIGLHGREISNSIIFQDRVDLCLFDYHIFDKATRQPVLAQYNLMIANDMLNGGSQKVFENEVVAVLKNNKVGGDCLEEGSF